MCITVHVTYFDSQGNAGRERERKKKGRGGGGGGGERGKQLDKLAITNLLVLRNTHVVYGDK